MVELVLSVGADAVEAILVNGRIVQNTGGRTVDHRLQSHFFKILQCSPHHALKAQLITDIHRRFSRQILAGYFKADTIPFRVSIRHGMDSLLRQRIHKSRHFQFIYAYILTVSIQITQIRKICRPDNVCRKIILRTYHFTYPLFCRHIRIITDEPVEDLTNGCIRGKLMVFLLFIYKCRIHLGEQLHPDHQLIQTSFVGKADQAPHFGIEKGCQCAECFSQTLHCHRWIGKAILIIFRQNIFIQGMIALL